jgi:hypothetical protein
VRNRILIAVSLLVVATLFWLVWMLPRGEGEYRDSPNGLWRAHASALSEGTLLLSRHRYIELKIERLADGVTVWRQRIPHISADTVPAYGDRGARSISWSPDSSQFSAGTTNGSTMTVPVPVAKDAQPGAASKGLVGVWTNYSNGNLSTDNAERIEAVEFFKDR